MTFQIWDDIRDLVCTDERPGQAGRPRPGRGHLHAAGAPGAGHARGSAGTLRALLGGPLDAPTRDKARDLVLSTDAGAVDSLGRGPAPRRRGPSGAARTALGRPLRAPRRRGCGPLATGWADRRPRPPMRAILPNAASQPGPPWPQAVERCVDPRRRAALVRSARGAGWERDDVADRLRAGEQHHQAVDADAEARRSAAVRTRGPGGSPRRRPWPPRRRPPLARACSSKRARCSSGSISSLKALPSSRPATMGSNRSTQPGRLPVVAGQRRHLLRVVAARRPGPRARTRSSSRRSRG